MNRLLFHRTKGGMLNLVLFISMIVAIVLSSMIVLQFYHKTFEADARISLTLHRNIRSALAWLGSEASSTLSNEKEFSIDLFGDGVDSITFQCQRWGVYERISIVAKRGQTKLQACGLFGVRSSEHTSHALILRNSRFQLKLIGNTRIIGNAMVPDAHVISGSLRGEQFNGDVFVDGVVEQSPQILPAIDSTYLAWPVPNADELEPIDLRADVDSAVNATSPSIFFHHDPLRLSSKISGPIIIVCESPVSIASESNLSSTIIIAPEVLIEDSVKGNFQVFAKRSIEVGNGVYLHYPSFLSAHNAQHCSLKVGASTVEGGLRLTSRDAKKSVMQLAKNSTVRGEVFSNAIVEPYGAIEGSLVCDKIRYVSGGEVRDNTLRNTTIDRSQLPNNFGFALIYPSQKKLQLIKWL